MNSEVTLITVQYNNPADTARFVSSVGALSDLDGCDIIVVDNSTSVEMRADQAALQGAAALPIQVLSLDENLYYWGGAAAAIEEMSATRERLPDWIVVCNNDIAIEDPLFIKRLRSLDGKKFPIVAPRITSRSGSEQNPFFESPPRLAKRLKWRIYDIDYRIARSMLFVHNAATRGRPQRSGADDKQRQIYAPHGAFVIFSAEFFRRGGKLDTTVPLFAEELTVAVTARRLGLPVWYCPQLHVLHREHSTTGRELTQFKYALERRARQRYYSLLEGAARNA